MKARITEVVNRLAPNRPRGFMPRVLHSDRGSDAELAATVAFGLSA